MRRHHWRVGGRMSGQGPLPDAVYVLSCFARMFLVLILVFLLVGICLAGWYLAGSVPLDFRSGAVP